MSSNTTPKSQSHFSKVALIGKFHAPSLTASAGVLEDVAQFLTHVGCKVIIESTTAQLSGISQYPTLDVQGIGAQCDLGLVVGGDGTMLGIGRQLAPYGVPLIGINQGRLGFITDIALDDYQSVLKPMLMGEFEEDNRSLIHGHVMRGGHCVFDALAMNDVVINRGGTSGMVELRVVVDGHFVANQRADGLIIATPTGSTAYSLSVGGPLLHPSVPGWVLAPIAPHNLSNRPIVLANAVEVTVEVVAGRDASANFDMQSITEMQIGDCIKVTKSQYSVRFLHPKGWSYYDTLRKKLHWNEGGS
jgi:NAD+ kinase